MIVKTWLLQSSEDLFMVLRIAGEAQFGWINASRRHGSKLQALTGLTLEVPHLIAAPTARKSTRARGNP